MDIIDSIETEMIDCVQDINHSPSVCSNTIMYFQCHSRTTAAQLLIHWLCGQIIGEIDMRCRNPRRFNIFLTNKSCKKYKSRIQKEVDPFEGICARLFSAHFQVQYT